MALRNRLTCLKWCILSSMRCNSGLQKQFCSSTVSRIERFSRQFPGDQEDNNDSGRNELYKSDHSCVQMSGDWPEELKTSVLQNMLVFQEYITKSEEDSIMAEIGPYLKRMRYEFDHWDNAIHGFRETERLQWRPENERVLRRVRQLALPPGTPPLRHVHVLDLAADGVIKPHVDSLRFCGNVISGISLMSDAVMRLVSCAEPTRRLDALLPRRSLYIMRNTARYDYTHEVLAQSESQFDGRPVLRDRRISIICRNEPAADGAGGDTGTSADRSGGGTGTSAADDTLSAVTDSGAAAAQDRS